MIRPGIRKRPDPLGWRSVLVICGAIGISLGVGAVFLALQGKPAIAGMALLFEGAFGSRWAIEDCLIKSVPIYMCSLGVAVAFRLRIWNIGAEGQFAMGAVGATWVALGFPGQPWYVLLPAMLCAASLFGGFWGFIPAMLKLKARANEIIVTLMFNYIAINFLEYLVYGPWKDPASGFAMTREFSPAAIVGKIGDTSVNWGILYCLVSGILVWIFFSFTRLGYEVKASGENVRAARYARMPYERLVVLVMVVSGALAGWAGFLEASATIGRLQPTIIIGYGYTAIVVAWLARLSPFNIAVASFLLAGLRVGLEHLQLDHQVPAAFGDILEGMMLLTVLAGSFFNRYQFILRRS